MLVPAALREADATTRFTLDQVSVLTNRRGALRGFHVAEHPGHTKLITCAAGAVWDVLIDLRQDSPTFRGVAEVHVEGSDPTAVLCPAGVAHGFLSLTEGSVVLIGVDDNFAGVTEHGFDALDPALGVRWPLPDDDFIRSARDASAPPLADLLGSGFRFPSGHPTSG
ncbi:dTDP-4-dehydrorhamnose 3,5-epimerase [Kytococcus sedentarius]|uniref:dTDP-4-dehydrorhamnose 3,5-epimerase-like enzyme n=2 Tax=Kytococcus sedentarius TaxID=1276 RepID=C7NJS8_KYTSD|nr:dTDP-4-dehydrorhamnose 3,5-epimerase-like enzyme [Kytococcus sedentarius DSM 20547]STX14315.1 dTDP-4-dehydrorhamnose 3,5-epimerase [Kytococcus sedentarius]